MKTFWWQQKWTLISYWFLTLAFISPQLFIRYPSLIDDGTDLLFVRNRSLWDIFISELFFATRSWPLRLVFRRVLQLLFGDNLGLHFLAQALVLFGIAAAVFYLLKSFNVNTKLARIGGLLVFLLPSTVANFYRLGTAEHLQILLVLMGLILLDKRRWWALLCFGVGCLVKETSLFYLLIPFAYYATEWKRSNVSFLLATTTIFGAYAGLLGWKSIHNSDAYVQQAAPHLAYMLKSFVKAPFSSYVLLVSAFFGVYQRTMKQHFTRHQFLLMMSLVVSVMPFLIWDMGQYYYHLPSQILALTLFVLLFNSITQHHHFSRFKLSLLSWLMFATLAFYFVPNAWQMGMYLHRQHVSEGALAAYILQNDWSEYSIFSAVEELERSDKIFHFFMVWNPDKSGAVFLPSKATLDKTNDNRQALSNLTERVESAFEKYDDPHKLLITRADYTNSKFAHRFICGSSPFVKEQCNWAVWYPQSQTTDVLR